MLQQAYAGLAPALNDNIHPNLAHELAESMAALRGFVVPDRRWRTAVAQAFSVFRLVLIGQEATFGCFGRRPSEHSRREVERTVIDLAGEPCEGAVDLAMKALAFHALVHVVVVNAARRREAGQLIAEADMLAQFAGALAADAVILADGAQS